MRRRKTDTGIMVFKQWKAWSFIGGIVAVGWLGHAWVVNEMTIHASSVETRLETRIDRDFALLREDIRAIQADIKLILKGN